MLSRLHHSLNGKDLSAESAQVIVNNLKQLIEDVELQFQSRDQEWEHNVLMVLRFLDGVQKGTYTARLRMVGYVEKHWDDLSLDFRLGYNNSFDMFVQREMDISLDTYRNYLRGITTFENIKPIGKIAVVKRDQFKAPILDKAKNPIIEYKDFDIESVPVTKLALMRSVAEAGQMTETRWSMLCDPGVTVDDLKVEIYKPNPTTGEDPSLRFTLEGPIIVATKMGTSIELGELFWDMYSEDIGKEAIDHLLRCLSIRLDEAVSRQHERRQEIIRVYKPSE